jgi:uncharacterized radical SAM superfamily protein
MKPLAAIKTERDLRGKSCLISGGCTAEGKVPLINNADKLAALKNGRRFNFHVGLIDGDEIERIAALADAVSFDFIGDDETIRDVLGLKKTVKDYVACYRQLRQHCRVMPHICIGLHGGSIKGEYKAMELLKAEGADSLTFIIFTPTKGTRFSGCKPPDIEAVFKLLAHARQLFADIPLHLGCMRPGGRYRNDIDQRAVRLGINTIVNPTPAAVRLAKELGLTILCTEECCVL